MKILITGAAGFIGFHLAKHYLEAGVEVVGLDNLNAYYDVQLKLYRLKELGINSSDIWYNKLLQSNRYPNFRFIQLNLEDKHHLDELFKLQGFDHVCHLAAQAGVRYSIDNPETYIQSNIVGFFNVLESCRQYPVQHLVFASSSSVYGNSDKVPFSESDNVDHPISLYAATKKSNELMAYTYSHLFNIPVTGLRFFTVYGPWGRPDMAYFKFTKAILAGQPIQVYNKGNLSRDFTYIDDIIQGIISVMKIVPVNQNNARYNLYNIGNNAPASLMEFIQTLEVALGKKAVLDMLPMQPGDVETTFADIAKLETSIGFKPQVSLYEGLSQFVEWYNAFYGAGTEVGVGR